MRIQSYVRPAAGVFLCALSLIAQPKPLTTPWRGAGSTPCVGSDGGVLQCPPAPETVAVRAGRLFDSKTGQMRTKQVVLLNGDRITDVGADGQRSEEHTSELQSH